MPERKITFLRRVADDLRSVKRYLRVRRQARNLAGRKREAERCLAQVYREIGANAADLGVGRDVPAFDAARIAKDKLAAAEELLRVRDSEVRAADKILAAEAEKHARIVSSAVAEHKRLEGIAATAGRDVGEARGAVALAGARVGQVQAEIDAFQRSLAAEVPLDKLRGTLSELQEARQAVKARFAAAKHEHNEAVRVANGKVAQIQAAKQLGETTEAVTRMAAEHESLREAALKAKDRANLALQQIDPISSRIQSTEAEIAARGSARPPQDTMAELSQKLAVAEQERVGAEAWLSSANDKSQTATSAADRAASELEQARRAETQARAEAEKTVNAAVRARSQAASAVDVARAAMAAAQGRLGEAIIQNQMRPPELLPAVARADALLAEIGRANTEMPTMEADAKQAKKGVIRSALYAAGLLIVLAGSLSVTLALTLSNGGRGFPRDSPALMASRAKSGQEREVWKMSGVGEQLPDMGGFCINMSGEPLRVVSMTLCLPSGQSVTALSGQAATIVAPNGTELEFAVDAAEVENNPTSSRWQKVCLTYRVAAKPSGREEVPEGFHITFQGTLERVTADLAEGRIVGTASLISDPSRKETASNAVRAERVTDTSSPAGGPSGGQTQARESPPPSAGDASGQLSLDLGNSVTMKLVLIPAGKFTMGSTETEKDRQPNEGPQHEVMVDRPFHMGMYEVTQEQYEAVMGSNPSNFKGAKNPVENVSWNDATEFCRKLSDKTGKAVSLPSEAQWEYACRAGTTTPFHTGQTVSTEQANYDGDSVYRDGRKGENRQKTVPVGSFKPNAFGLYDMHGNVAEWCSDRYLDSYANTAAPDPLGPACVMRGGSWCSPPSVCRSASRLGCNPVLGPGFRGYFGFRIVVGVAD